MQDGFAYEGIFHRWTDTRWYAKVHLMQLITRQFRLWLTPAGMYINNHWRGRQPLPQVFWINLVSISFLLHMGAEALLSAMKKELYSYSLALVLSGALIYGAISYWQFVGTIRTVDNHIRNKGDMFVAWVIHAGLLVAFVIVLLNMWGLWLITQIDQEAEHYLERMEREHASKYEFTLSDDLQSLYLKGEIASGVTRRLSSLLSEYPQLQNLVLHSNGGNIYEGRGMAKQIREAGLNTHVDSVCSSACTLAFIGGVERSKSSHARIGFHQYRLEADYQVPFSDPQGEQQKDASLFAASGVNQEFLQLMYKAPDTEMWFPADEILIQFGVITLPAENNQNSNIDLF